MPNQRPAHWTPEEEKHIRVLERLSRHPMQAYHEYRAEFRDRARSWDAFRRKIRTMELNGDLRRKRVLPTDAMTGLRIGYFDIEVTDLDADIGNMLTWCIKERDNEKYYTAKIRKDEIFRPRTHLDRRIVRELLNTMRRFDVLVHFYGDRFDFPFSRSRALRLGMDNDFPGFGQIRVVDVFYQARRLMKLRRRSLQRLTEFFNIPGKTCLAPEVWQLARYGDRAALAEVMSHNIEDCKILEAAHKRLEPFVRGIPRGA